MVLTYALLFSLTPKERMVTSHTPVLTQGVTGFLPKKAAAAAARPWTPGSLLEVVVAAPPKPGGVVTVACGQEAVAGAVAREWEGLNIGLFASAATVAGRMGES